jgi:uncharacterized protein YggE
MPRSSLAAFSFPVALLACAPMQAQQPAPMPIPVGRPAPTPPSQLVVSATGESRYTPDRATVRFGVESRAATARASSQANATVMQKVVAAVRAAGIASEDISTANFSVTPDLQYDPKERTAKVVGYVTQNSVVVRIVDLGKTGAVLDAALGAGANVVQEFAMTLADPDAARREALADAVARAKADAEVMAKASGGRLGELIELSAADVDVPIAPKMELRAMAAVADAATPVEAGSRVLSARVTARWQWLPAR